MIRKALLAAITLLCVPALARAQGEPCDLGGSRQLNYVSGGAIIYVGGPIFTCQDGARITADSAIYLRETGRVDFIGNVRFSDPERTLTAQNAQYLRRERRIMAQVNVVLTSKEDGSTLRGSAMDYYQRSEQYPEGRIDVHSGRPRAVLLRGGQNAAPDTTIVDADRMQIIGEQLFRGWGNVQSRRGDIRSRSEYAEFDETADRMRLVGQATVESDTFRLRADSIEAVLANRDEFREMHAFRQVLLESEEVDLTAPVVHMTFLEGKVERLIAIGGARIEEGAPQARAVSLEFVLVADSIDALAPNQALERVFAVGSARGEVAPDSVQDRDLPELIRTDWVQGDTIRAYFAAAPDTMADTTRVLERIVAHGDPASSTYRLREQSGDSVELSVNYITARMLDVKFKDGEVHHVLAEGDIRGMYLQPPARAEAIAPGPGSEP